MNKTETNRLTQIEVKEKIFCNGLLKTSCFLTGDDYYRVSQLNDPESNKKIQQLAGTMLLPMVLWVISVYLIMLKVFHAEWWLSWIGALCVGLILFIIERSIVLSTSVNWKTRLMRFVLAFCLALVGSFFIDEVIFEKDIDNQLMVSGEKKVMENAQIQKDKAQANNRKLDEDYENNVIKPKQQMILEKEKALEKQTQVVNEESGGQATGVRGAGSATRSKAEQAERIRADLKILRAELKAAEKNRPNREARWTKSMQDHDPVETAVNAFKANPKLESFGLMDRIGAMVEILLEKWYMALFWGFFTLLFILIEMLPVVIKGNGKKTLYERMTEQMAYSTSFPKVAEYD